VDQVGIEERAAALGKRSIKKESKRAGIRLAISMIDLTTLEGKDSEGKVRQLCQKAMRPSPGDPTVPHVAAVCVYPNLVPVAREALAGSGVKVASVATGFPAGLVPLPVKIDDVRRAVAMGADEIDMVIDRGAFLAGEYAKVTHEILAIKDACGDAHLKVILETGELETFDNVRKAPHLAIAAGADFIRPYGRCPPRLMVVSSCSGDSRFHLDTGRRIGMKPRRIKTSNRAPHARPRKNARRRLVDAHLFHSGPRPRRTISWAARQGVSGRYQMSYFTKD
jgi:deoxyribose-phosphate aldolase